MLSEYVKTADWKSEKHVPVICAPEKIVAGVPFEIHVTVGAEIAHPNTTAHHISWIAVHFVPAGAKTSVELGRCEFSAHGASVEGPDKGVAYTESKLVMSARLAVEGTLFATAYCNIHGLWSSEKAVVLA